MKNIFYISTDLKDSFIYIASLLNDQNHTWLLRFDDRFEADNTLRKLTAKLTPPPSQPLDTKKYVLDEKINHPTLGELYIYRTL